MTSEQEPQQHQNKEPEPNRVVNTALRMTITALMLGLCFEILFEGHPLGISFPVWAALCVGALLVMAKFEDVHPSRPELALIVAILFFSFMTVLRQEPMTVFLAVMITLALFTLWVYTFREGRLIDFGWVDFLLTLIWVPLESWIRPWPVAGTAWRQMMGKRGGRSRVIPVLRGLLIALPVLVVFIGLLGSADMVFADYVSEALRWLDLEQLTIVFRRTLVVVISAMFFLGALVVALREPGERYLTGLYKLIPSPFLGFIEAVIVLVFIDLLFAAFVFVQFTYLFGGQANITAAGYTYAEYARKGFGELTMVAFLSLGMITVLSAWTRREGRGRESWFNGLSSGLVVLIGVIMVSAFKRLLLYENAYGFTRLRTYTHVAIIWMAVLFAVFLGLLLTNRLKRFAPSVVIGVLGFAATLILLNVDAFIVSMNAARFAETGKIDIRYLSILSEDAIPSLVQLYDEATEEVRADLLPHLACRRTILQEQAEEMSWQSYHLSRASAFDLLTEMEVEFKDYVVEHKDWRWVVTGPDGEQPCNLGWD